MKLLAIFLFIACATFAQDNKPVTQSKSYEMPYHPYRKVGDRYYSLQPIYDWSRLLHIPAKQITKEQAKSVRPMPEWIGETSQIGLPYHTVYRVEDVKPEGLVIASENLNSRIEASGRRYFLLINYPFSGQVSDRQSIRFLALKTGVRKVGAHGTLEVYDYGAPYDPRALAAERAKTNQPVVAKTNTPKTGAR